MSTKDFLRDLRAQFRKYAIEPERLFLLNAEQALELVERATAGGARLAGIEGFLITAAGAYQPRQDFSNDASAWDGTPDQFVQSTKELIRGGAADGIRFQVAFEGE
jgi:hypothetical protein